MNRNIIEVGQWEKETPYFIRESAYSDGSIRFERKHVPSGELRIRDFYPHCLRTTFQYDPSVSGPLQGIRMATNIPAVTFLTPDRRSLMRVEALEDDAVGILMASFPGLIKINQLPVMFQSNALIHARFNGGVFKAATIRAEIIYGKEIPNPTTKENFQTLINFIRTSEDADLEVLKDVSVMKYQEVVSDHFSTSETLLKRIQDGIVFHTLALIDTVANGDEAFGDEMAQLLSKIGWTETLMTFFLKNLKENRNHPVKTALARMGSREELINMVINYFIDSLSTGTGFTASPEIEVSRLGKEDATIGDRTVPYGESIRVQNNSIVLSRENDGIGIVCLKQRGTKRWSGHIPTTLESPVFYQVLEQIRNPDLDFRQIKSELGLYFYTPSI